MNCQGFEGFVADLARQELLETAERERALAHAEACPSCRARLEAEKSLMNTLREVAVGMRDLQAPAEVEARLQAAFRRQAVSQPARPGARASTVSWLARVVAAGMAAALALAVLLLVRDPLPRLAKRTAITTETLDPSLPAESGRGREIATDFFPLTYIGPLTSSEPYHLVRVKLPRSALLYFGLPVRHSRGEQVLADVLLGVDGTARAVRFVRAPDRRAILGGY